MRALAASPLSEREAVIVPSGVTELSRLQQLGYTYIKP